MLGLKGLYVIRAIDEKTRPLIGDVVIGLDNAVKEDYSKLIAAECMRMGIRFSYKNDCEPNAHNYSIAIGWRWLINDNCKVVVFHDSLLPRLRGFNPLVTALINGDAFIGVTALDAVSEFDKGPIIRQKSLEVHYPIKIQQAIEQISSLYVSLFNEVVEMISLGAFTMALQDESSATYSLWRDEEDYLIDWSFDAATIKRFIDAVGFPYEGAKSFLDGRILTIQDAEVVDDVVIENRCPGKVLFKSADTLTVVCGKGLLRIYNVFDESGHKLDFSKRFRLRFK